MVRFSACASLVDGLLPRAAEPFYNGLMPVQIPVVYQNLDELYMARCLALAEWGAATVSPNPMVGAVVLDAQGRKVGEGYHQRAGERHAEIIALDEAGERARGGTLYVNLEPCNHQGRTPPCTHRITESGIQRVVCGTLDPNPLVSGMGRDALQNARISVRYGYLEEACRRLNEMFFHYITSGQPFVTLKLAMSLDGKLALRDGTSQWMTGPFARQYVHDMRHRHDAILTTAETVLADDPLLTVRDVPVIQKQPVRIVLDRRFRLNVDKFRLFKSGESPVWVVTSRLQYNKANVQRARAQGIRVLEVDEIGGRLNLSALMTQLGQEKIASVMVEAGGGLAGSLVADRLVNRYALFYAPKIVRDNMARPAFGNRLQLDLPQQPELELVATYPLEQDWVVEARPHAKKRPV